MPLNLCGGVNGDVLLREVLCSTGMVRYVCDGGCEVSAQLCLLCVADLVDVIEDSGNKVVDSCLGNVVASDDDCCNSNGGHVFGSVVDVLGDGVLFVVGAGSDQAVNVLLVEGDEVDLLAGAIEGCVAWVAVHRSLGRPACRCSGPEQRGWERLLRRMLRRSCRP